MNIKQLLLVTAIQIVLALILILPQMPDFVQELVHGPEYYDSGSSKVYGIIFKSGIITMLIFSTVFVGTRTKNELKFILFSEGFLAIIFYKNYDENSLVLTLTFLVIAFVVFLSRIPIRKFITNKKILA
ncbi:MAG: hypothetical protein KAG37_05270 [Flavobacteriales bacterium]|nr:hypothetical protein [Flavobacteriales bacterium]